MNSKTVNSLGAKLHLKLAKAMGASWSLVCRELGMAPTTITDRMPIQLSSQPLECALEFIKIISQKNITLQELGEAMIEVGLETCLTIEYGFETPFQVKKTKTTESNKKSEDKKEVEDLPKKQKIQDLNN